MTVLLIKNKPCESQVFIINGALNLLSERQRAGLSPVDSLIVVRQAVCVIIQHPSYEVPLGPLVCDYSALVCSN